MMRMTRNRRWSKCGSSVGFSKTFYVVVGHMCGGKDFNIFSISFTFRVVCFKMEIRMSGSRRAGLALPWTWTQSREGRKCRQG